MLNNKILNIYEIILVFYFQFMFKVYDNLVPLCILEIFFRNYYAITKYNKFSYMEPSHLINPKPKIQNFLLFDQQIDLW